MIDIMHNKLIAKFVGMLITLVIFVIVTTVIIMASYNYVGPTLSSLFTGNTKEVSNDIFVPISFWESMVLSILVSSLAITKCC